MRLSEERVAVLARLITDNLLDEELIDLEIDEDGFKSLVERLILQDLMVEDQIDEEATAFLLKNKPNLEEGSTAWEVELERKKEELSIAKGYVSY
ncbi:hypothetical protein CSB20_06140 [bacterium DOLZORAL124_64_63]|nr:MAG: hypothetical protein CSB20_06140 [bacterium DOLZORAL124_64_63]